jgi:Cu/Ag efflux pump CusA
MRAVLAGGVVSLGSLAGVLVVLGIVIHNGPAITAHRYERERDRHKQADASLIVRGLGEQMPAIVMSALAAFLALLPAWLLGDLPGLETMRPMAIVVLGGLVTTRTLDLFVLPALNMRYGLGREAGLDLAPVPATAD